MSMIYRLHEGGANTLNGWEASQAPTTSQIQEIPDPQGGQMYLEVNSIPSPFGRLEFVRSAFEEVVASKQLEGDTLYHKVVSDTLDVAQIFFDLERLRKQGLVEVIEWVRKSELETLLQASGGHRELGRALDKYLEQDAESFNFDKLESVYILNYIGSDRVNDILPLGAISPVSLFVPAPGRDKDVASKTVVFGNDRPFDKDLCPLHKRADREFIKWIYAISKSVPSFSRLFKCVYEYLELVRSHLDASLREEVLRMSDDALSQGDYLPAEVTFGNPIYLLPGLPLYVRSDDAHKLIEKHSDFVISTKSRDIVGKKPLVLPTGTFKYPLHYVSDKWNPANVVPEADVRPLSSRTLPDDGTEYPYLTASDFLEDNLIKIANEIDDEVAWTAEQKQDAVSSTEYGCEYSYLLPLKPLFFEYFTPEELVEERMLLFKRKQGNEVVVELKIPIRGGQPITYERKYRSGGSFDVSNYCVQDLDHIELFLAETSRESRTLLAYEKRSDKPQLRFYGGDGTRLEISEQASLEMNKEQALIYAYRGKASFVQIEQKVRDVQCSGLILLQSKAKARLGSLVYSVDLGTTNTCISYKEGDGVPKLLEWSKEEQLVRSLTLRNDRYEFLAKLDSEIFLPLKSDVKTKLPMRTVLRAPKFVEWGEQQRAFLFSSPSFIYHREEDVAVRKNGTPAQAECFTGLKWARTTEEMNRLRSYIESLCFALALHAESRGSGGADLKLLWHYPEALRGNALKELSSYWSKSAQRYFGDDVEPQRLLEAISPYYYHHHNSGAVGATISIDMGGGTVDCLFVSAGEHGALEPRYQTSYLYGGNALYGSLSNYQPLGNAFAHVMLEYLKNQSEKTPDYISSSILKQMEEEMHNAKAEEAVSLFFALPDRLRTDAKDDLKVDLSFETMMITEGLQEQLQIIPFLYLAALAYQLANQAKALGEPIPSNILFSGMGSKILGVVDDELLKQLFTYIFAQVYGRSAGNIKIICSKDPKVATTSGGIYYAEKAHAFVLKASVAITLETIEERGAITDTSVLTAQLRKQVQDFTLFFKKLVQELRLEKDWGLSRESLALVGQELPQGLDDQLQALWTQLRSEQGLSPEEPLEEVGDALFLRIISERLRYLGLRLIGKIKQ